MKFIRTLVMNMICKRSPEETMSVNVDKTEEGEKAYSLLHSQMGAQILTGIF